MRNHRRAQAVDGEVGPSAGVAVSVTGINNRVPSNAYVVRIYSFEEQVLCARLRWERNESPTCGREAAVDLFWKDIFLPVRRPASMCPTGIWQ